MFIDEILISSFTLLMIILSILAIINEILHDSLPEMKLIALSYIFAGIYVFFIFLSLLFYQYFSIYDGALLLRRIASIGFLSLIFLNLAIILPDIEYNYFTVFFIAFISASTVASMFCYIFTESFIVKNNFMVVSVNPLGVLFLVSSITCILLSFGNKIYKISLILKEKPCFFTSFKTLLIFFLLLFIAFLTLILSRAETTITISSDLWFIPLSLVFVYFSYAFKKDPAFFFITSTKIEALIIAEKNNGISIFSHSFNENQYAEDLLASLLTALDMSFKEALQSTKRIERIIYGDKAIVFSFGEKILVILIVTQFNFVCRNICILLKRKFEKRFHQVLFTEEPEVHNIKVFENFDAEVLKIQRYFPL